MTRIFTATEEQEQFRSSVRRFAEASGDRDAVRALLDDPDGFDRGVWTQMAEQGLQGLHLPEEHGGSGFGFAELAIVFEELGRRLLPSPLLATTAASTAILHAGTDEQRARWLPGIAAGERIATLAHADALDGADGLGVEAGDESTLSGSVRHVLDGRAADLVVVPARVPEGGLALYVVEGDADGLSRSPLESMDLTRRTARLDLDGIAAERLGGGDPGGALRRTLDLTAVCLAAEMLGGAQVCLEMATQYAKDRYQFGRPIGSFQAIKHRCADMLVDVESARSAVQYAAWAAQDRPDELATVAALALAFTGDAAVACANRNIYVHGGIGYTWEHDAHLYLRRAAASRVLLGDPRHHRRRLAAQLVDA